MARFRTFAAVRIYNQKNDKEMTLKSQSDGIMH